MTTKSHQPEFVAEIIGKTLDHLTDDRKRVAVDFELAENGCMEETHVSLKRRIAAMWGFQTRRWWLFAAAFLCVSLFNFDYSGNGILLMLILFATIKTSDLSGKKKSPKKDVKQAASVG